LTTLLLGLGNILLRDEGIGVHTVNRMREEWSFSPEVEIIDGGTLGLDLLPYFEKYSRILIVDAVDFGKEPGYISLLKDGDVLKPFSKKLSVHNIGLADILFSCQLIDIKPAEIIIIGIQPKSMDIGLDMTEEIGGKMPDLINTAIKTLENWDIKCVLQSPQRF
jgi:hydrogenase maturation protease